MLNLIDKHKNLLKEMILYGIIGVISSTMDAVSFYLFRQISIPILLSNFISTNIGITISFFLNTFLNFKKKDNLLKRAISFYIVGYFGLLLSTLILYIFTKVYTFDEMIVKIISIIFVAMVQYVLNKFVTFGGKE